MGIGQWKEIMQGDVNYPDWMVKSNLTVDAMLLIRVNKVGVKSRFHQRFYSLGTTAFLNDSLPHRAVAV